MHRASITASLRLSLKNPACIEWGLAPSGSLLTKQGSQWLLTHSNLKEPLARLHESEYLAVDQLRKHLLKLDKVTKSNESQFLNNQLAKSSTTTKNH